MATTIATVTPEGLALPADFVAEQNLRPGTEVTVTIASSPPHRLSPEEAKLLIEKTQGMLANLGGGMADELIEQRREDEGRSKPKHGDVLLRCQRSPPLPRWPRRLRASGEDHPELRLR